MNENPQKENGHIGIANEIAEALARTYLTSYESRILWVIFRKTYGWQKKDDWIAISQFVEMTGMHKSHVSRSIKLLCQRNIVTKRGNKLSFNKYYSQWKELPNGVTNHLAQKVTKRGTIVTKRGNAELPNGAYTKETPTKETIQKKSIPTEYGNAGVNTIMKTMEECFGNLDGTKAKNRQYAWLLLKKAKSLQPNATDEAALKSCVQLIRAASQHNWWKSRITKVETIYKNAHMITKALQEEISTSFTPQI